MRRPRPGAGQRLGRRLLLGGVAAVLTAVPFTLLLLLVESEWEPLERLDIAAARRLHEIAASRPPLVQALRFGADALDPWVFRLLVLLTVGWLWSRGAPRLALWAAVTMVVGGVLGVVLKLVVARARPELDDPVAVAVGYSFPSGHALNSFLGVGVLLLVFLPRLAGWRRWAAWLLGAAAVLATGFDRVALGVHYPSDVVAGWTVALVCLISTTVAFEAWRRDEAVGSRWCE